MDGKWSRLTFIVVCATLVCGIVANLLIWGVLQQGTADRIALLETRVTELERTAITR